MDITHDNVCSSMLSCFYSHLLSTGRPISSFTFTVVKLSKFCQLRLRNSCGCDHHAVMCGGVGIEFSHVCYQVIQTVVLNNKITEILNCTVTLDLALRRCVSYACYPASRVP